MDPMSFLLEDPLYHLTNDIYGFELMEIPFELPFNLESNKTLEEPGHLAQTTIDMYNNDTNPRNESSDDPRIEGGDQGNNVEIMNGGVAVEEPITKGGRKRKKKEKKKEDKAMENEKLTMHREVEKQRRQEMSSLHRSLRNLLPAEYLKGKRSMSDHLHEAVKYIRHLKANNQALEHKKEKLKTPISINPNTTIVNQQEMLGGMEEGRGNGAIHRLTRFVDQVVVKACKEGVEVLVRVSRQEDGENGMSTSRVLKAVIQEGLDVTSCISTHMENDKWLHCIHAQVGEGNTIYSELQKKLTKKLSAQYEL